MIVPDTNVISETLRSGGNPAVAAWRDKQSSHELHMVSPVLAELLLGAALLPEGGRRRRLTAAIEFVVERKFRARILPFDDRAARHYARLMAEARRAGRAIATFDGQIAAIAAAHGLSVATRDTAPFAAAGIPTINPWRPQ